MACEELEIALEMRRRGALDAVEAQRVADHLASCVSCQAYDRAMAHMEETMTTMTMAATQQLNWAEISERIGRMGQWHRRAFLRAIVLLPILLPVIVLWTMPAEIRLFGWVLGVAVSAAMLTRMTLERRRFQREAAEAAGSREDLLAFWRRDVDRRIGMLRFWPVNLVAAILLPLPAILDRSHALPTGGAALVYGLALFMLIQGLYYGVIGLPRLRRERAELE